MHSVVAFCGDSEFKTAMPPYVLDMGYADYIRGKKIILFSDAEVLALVDKLKAGMLERGQETDQKHLDSLRERHAKKAATLTLEPIGGESGKRALRGKQNRVYKGGASAAWRHQAGKQRKSSNKPARIVMALLFAGALLFIAKIFV